MTSVSPNRGVPWKTAVIAAFSVALLAWFLRGINFHELGRALANAHPGFIAAAALVTLQTYTFRAWRWQALLAPIGGASFRNSFRITVIGFTATNLLPGRLGEVLRPYLIARAEPVSAPAAFATILIERLLDLSTVMLLFGVFLLTSTIDVSREVKGAGLVAAVASITGLVGLIFGAGRPETLRRWADNVAGWLPARVADIARRFAHTLVDGLAVMRRPRNLLVAVVMSLCLWLSIALGIWFASRALDLTMAFPSTFLIVMYLVVGVAVPVPAGVGSFHFMYQLAATTILGANREQASAAAIVLHAVSFVPISLLGLAYMAQDGWTLARLRSVEPDGGPEAQRRKL
jgi:glycosyltransferase 2 family protein